MSFFHQQVITHNQLVFRTAEGIELHLKREDQIDPVVSGNKFRKLKYNLAEAKKQGKNKLLTFGGAFSNHILAVAKAGQLEGFETIGIIRGEELEENQKRGFPNNPTLNAAERYGMKFWFVDRETYRAKTSEDFLKELVHRYGACYILPEGGTNALAVKGCAEILNGTDEAFDFICCAAGTGGTAAGLIEASILSQKVLVFPALKGDFLENEIEKYTDKTNWQLLTDYHFGGYGKVSKELVMFLNAFYLKHKIPLDPVYTGKMLFGLQQMIDREYFSENSRILAVHTGGLQGIAGMNKILAKKGKNYAITYDI